MQMPLDIGSQTPALYAMPMDEQALFSEGVASWRMDIHTTKVVRWALSRTHWVAPDPEDIPCDAPDQRPEKPIGLLAPQDAVSLRDAFDRMLNDPVLTPNLRMMGRLETRSVEIQDGAYDSAWHHDGLAGRRHGHAGDFFLIVYFGEPAWDCSWGGYFEYGTRALSGNWARENFTPDTTTGRIAPRERTVVLGWNGNPRFVHRAPPVQGRHTRITMIAPVALRAQG